MPAVSVKVQAGTISKAAAPSTVPAASRSTTSTRSRLNAAAAPWSGRLSTILPLRVQTATRVSSPHDPAEREAAATARKIVDMPRPSLQSGGRLAIGRQASASSISRAPLVGSAINPSSLVRSPPGRAAPSTSAMPGPTAGEPSATADIAAEIRGSMTGGVPLPPDIRQFMEPRFRADFTGVRIHTDDKAAGLARRLGARAFAFGRHIFFGRGEFRPQSRAGMELIAHELTHTIQQREVVQRQEEVRIAEHSPVQVQRFGISDVLDYFAEKAYLIPGFRMFTIIIGVNPVNMSRVDRSAANILRALIEFIPGGALITQAMDNYGIFDRIGSWVEQQIETLGMAASAIRQAIDEFIDSLSWSDIFDLGGVWERAKRIFTRPIDRIISFAAGLVTGIIGFIKDAILRPLARLAEGTRGYDLLKAVLGRDPITGEAVPRTAETLIGGFMKLIGQEEIWNNIRRANAIPRAWTWFQGALSGLIGFVQQIPTLFLNALRSLELFDIVLVPRAFAKIAGVFGNFIGNFFSWAGNTIWSLLEIIFQVVAPSVMVYLRRAAAAFRTIIRDPIRFVGNLVRAGLLGFRQFASNFLTHLRTSLIGWLTGTMSGANIYIPQAFTLREIIKFVLSVLGLTWQNIRGKLVRVIGETAVAALERGFDIVLTLVTQGPAAAWEKIQESLTNLREMVMEQIMTFVRDRVVQAAITRLVTSLNPAGAFIQAIIAIYNTIMFFVERIRQIGQVVAAFIDSISAIANGVIAAAANRVEQTMAGLLTLVISFLARIAGLGRVSDAVTNIINRVRQPIDRALDRVVEWIVAQARRLGRLIAGTARRVVGRVVGWWRTRKAFRDVSGQSHSLYFAGEGRAARLMLASDPRSFQDVLRDLTVEISNREALQRQLNAIASKITTRGENLGTEQQQDAFQADIERDVNALAGAIGSSLGHRPDLPASVVTWGPNARRAGSVRAEPLTINPGNTTGSAATGHPTSAAGYGFVMQWDLPTEHTRHTEDGRPIQVQKTRVTGAHLLHHNLHGPYEANWNVALADQGLNNRTAPLENRIVNEKTAGNKIRYITTVTYFSNDPPPENVNTIEEASPDAVRAWVDFYTVHTMSLSAYAWQGDGYTRKIVDEAKEGERTPIRLGPRITIEGRVLDVLKQNLVLATTTTYQGALYVATTVTNVNDLAVLAGRRANTVLDAVRKLLEAKSIYKPGLRGPYYVKQGA